jgi:hypothetical protein
VPLLPASLTEPLWVEFAALIESDRPEFDPTHPWGCHRRRVPNRVVFDHVIAALVHGSGYERIATPGCSDRTIRRRLDDWADAGVGEQVLRTALAGYDQMIGLDLDDLSVDGSITKSPCGGEVAGRSPVDRGKQVTKRSVACDNQGVPLHLVAARANDHDSPLLEPTLAGIVEMIGPLPQHRGVHGRDLYPTCSRPCTWTAATTPARPATCWRSSGSPARSRSRASRPRSRPADGGRSSAPTPG